MRIRFLVILLALLAGGCLATRHEHFSSEKGDPLPLKAGRYACVADTSMMPDRGGRPPPSIFTNDSTLALFFNVLEIRAMAQGNRYALTGTSGNARPFAFHKVSDDIYAASTTGQSTFSMNWFFRVSEGRLALLFHMDTGALETLAVKMKVRLHQGMPPIDGIEGTKENERAFIDAFIALPTLRPASNCTFVSE